MERKLSEMVIGCALEVHRTLGQGFLERVYESALAIELRAAGLQFEQQKAMTVLYRGMNVGEYCCDFLVGSRLIVELKALSATGPGHEAQVLNYLKATGITAGLLLNFGSHRLGIRRLVMQHDDSMPV